MKNNRAQAMSDCLFCLSSGTSLWFHKLANENNYAVRRCKNCHSAMVLPRPSQKDMDDYYSRHTYGIAHTQNVIEEDCSYYPNSRMDAIRLVNRISKHAPGVHFLDVGAGTGFFSHEAKRQGFEVTALEPNPNSTAAFRDIAGFEPYQQVLDQDFACKRAHSMDAVLLSQVLEHISDLEGMLSCLVKVLRPGGIVAIAVPHFHSYLSQIQGKKDMYITPPEHINFFSVSGLDSLFSRHGLHRVDLETVSKVPVQKIKNRLGIAGSLGWRVLHTGLSVADKLGKGMVINAYYRYPQ